MATNRSCTPPDTLRQIVKEKHAQLPGIMADADIDCWLIFVRDTAANPDPVMDLAVGSEVIWESAFIFTRRGSELHTLAIVGDFDADHETSKVRWDEVIPYTEGIAAVLAEKLSEIDPKRLGLNYSLDDATADGLSHGMYLRLASILPDFSDRFVSAAPIIQALRSRKSETEVALITAACELTERINARVARRVEAGMTELQIQILYHQEMDAEGVMEAWQRSGCPAVDAGPDKALGHSDPTHLCVVASHTLHNDFGVKLHGYCSDLQRMWFLGHARDIPDELQHAFEAVRDGIKLAADTIRPGSIGHEIDQLVREHLKSRGYDEYQHALGHQVGTLAHDGGMVLGPLWERYGDLPKGQVREGNVFTLEFYVKTVNFGMVSLEENIVITKQGCRFLVPRQTELYCIRPG